jgi:hypothetical protein
MRPLRELWANGAAPWPLRLGVELVRLGRNERLVRTFGRAFRGGDAMPLEMEIL